MSENTTPDIRLVVGVNESLSYSEMRRGILSVVSKLNAENFKIKINLSSDELNRFRNEVRSLLASMSNVGKNGYINPNVLTQFDSSLKSSHKSVQLIKNSIKELGGGYSGELDRLTSTYNKFEHAVNSLHTNFARGKVTSSELSNIAKLRTETDKLINSLNIRVSAQKKVANTPVGMTTAGDTVNLEKQAVCLSRISTLMAQCAANQKNWSAAAHGVTSGEYAKYDIYIKELQLLEQQLSSGAISVGAFNERLKTIQSNINRTNSVIKMAGKNTKSFVDRFGSIASKLGAWFSAQRVLYAVYRVFREMIANVQELDKAMTELKKVTDATEDQYIRFLDGAIKRAKKLGATLVDTVNSSADMARLGYNLTDASTLADTALVYKNVGDGISNIDEASSSIISTMQAFKVEAKDSMSIVDKFNVTGNNFAIASGGIGTALLNSASALAAANNTLDESIGLITAANTVVQDPSKVGTALKTVSMYLRAAKTEADEAGESSDGMASSVSELRGEILALTGKKVDIQSDDNTLKSTYQILKELSAVWNDLTDISRANILEMIGGKRNSNVVSALLNNFDIVDKVISKTDDSTGSALAENEKYIDSINGKISVFKANFESLSNSIINSDFFKTLVDSGSSLISILDGVIGKLGPLNSLIMGITAAMSLKNIGKDKTFSFLNIPMVNQFLLDTIVLI